MKVLVAGETSGKVRNAFRKQGHDAWSCDLLPADDSSCYHVQGDARGILANNGWDLLIAHPPCTYLCNSGVRWLYKGGAKEVINAEGDLNIDEDRWAKMEEAAKLFEDFLHAPIEKIAVENPVMGPMPKFLIGEQTQCVQPWFFGEPAFKATCLWLKKLPPLRPVNVLVPPKPGTPEHKAWSKIHRASPGPNRWKIRSETFQGIADAMASQWGQISEK